MAKASQKNEKGKKGKAKEAAEPLQPQPSAKAEGSNSAYSAGNFQAVMAAFVKQKRSELAISHSEARQMWMLSSERSDLLSTLSERELKRRKFA